jgi:hypothetical protein
MKMNVLKRELILNAAQDIIEYLDDKYCVDADIYDIAELINLQCGFVFEIAEKHMEKYE